MPERHDEEGYIAHWDARQGRGHIRAALPTPAMLPFSRADLQPATLQPRLGMAVRFTRQAGPTGDRALAVRPWAPDPAVAGAAGRRARRPVFQATGAAPLGALPVDPLQDDSARDARDGSRMRPVRGAQGRSTAGEGFDAALDPLGPQPTRPAPLTPPVTVGRSAGRAGPSRRITLPRWLVLAALAALLATGLGLLLGWIGARS